MSTDNSMTDSVPFGRPRSQEFERLAAKKGCKPSQLALAWLMAQGDHIIPIPGVRGPPRLYYDCREVWADTHAFATRRPAQTKSEKYLVENFAARDGDLSADEVAEIRKVVEENAPVGDRYPAAHMKSLDE